MKYVKPTYEKEAVETSDVILASAQGVATIKETNQTSAQVFASVLDILGIK